MADALIQPQLTIDDPGSATNGTIFGGPFSSPLTIEENGLQFIIPSQEVQVKDAVARTTAGAALAQDHALAICKGHINNVIGFLRSGDLTPGSAQRHAPSFKLKAGVTYYFKSIQLSGAQEAARWTLYFA